jgi:hypothetical protein
VLYRRYLWVWAFRDLTREVPTVVLVDDHDVYHPNLWGIERLVDVYQRATGLKHLARPARGRPWHPGDQQRSPD